MSESLFSLIKKSDTSDSLVIGANRSQKLAISSKKIHIFVFCAQERIAPVLLCSVTLFEELREGFTPVALYKRATVSSCHSLQKSDHEGFAQVAHDKREMERFALLHKQIAFRSQ